MTNDRVVRNLLTNVLLELDRLDVAHATPSAPDPSMDEVQWTSPLGGSTYSVPTIRVYDNRLCFSSLLIHTESKPPVRARVGFLAPYILVDFAVAHATPSASNVDYPFRVLPATAYNPYRTHATAALRLARNFLLTRPTTSPRQLAGTRPATLRPDGIWQLDVTAERLYTPPSSY